MPMIEWTPRMSVGVAEFDNEHKVLIGLVNELFDAMREGHGKQAVEHVLDGLLSYTVTHFEHEERMMRQYGYPEMESHIAEHKELARKAQEIRSAILDHATSADAMKTMNFITKWLTTHIQGRDAGYTKFFNGAGVR